MNYDYESIRANNCVYACAVTGMYIRMSSVIYDIIDPKQILNKHTPDDVRCSIVHRPAIFAPKFSAGAIFGH